MLNILEQADFLKVTGLRTGLQLLIENAASAVNPEHYTLLNKEFASFYVRHLEKDDHPALMKVNIDHADSRRVVIVGDLHSDFNSLASIFRKLAAGDYDYFEKALFIFTGDYTDRGSRPLQTLRLLYGLSEYLGDRCIFMKGNHEVLSIIGSSLRPTVWPSDTWMALNPVLDQHVRRLHYEYYTRLPYTVIIRIEKNSGYSGQNTGSSNPTVLTASDAEFPALSTKPLTVLIAHGGIPRHDMATLYDENILADLQLPVNENNGMGLMAWQMLWGDPSEGRSFLNNDSVRFEYRREEFDRFMNKHGYDILIRSHEAVENGYHYLFGNRILTLFSTGGVTNTDTAYAEDVPSPAFAIIDEDGRINIERIFT